MSRCQLHTGRLCLCEHIRVKTRTVLLSPSPNQSVTSLNMLCPAHDDTRFFLVISVATQKPDSKRLVWYCHSGCPEMAVRDALISE